MLKKGDVVVCDIDYNQQFSKGKEYVMSKDQTGEGEWARVYIERDDRGHPNDWMAKHFKLKETKVNKSFKKGDLVIAAAGQETRSGKHSLQAGKIYVVDSVGMNGTVYLAGRTHEGFDDDRFKLAYDELQALLDAANEGTRAIDRLANSYSDLVETIYTRDGSSAGDFSTELLKNYRDKVAAAYGDGGMKLVKKKAAVFKSFNLRESGHPVEVSGSFLRVGCQKTLDLKLVTKGLKDLLNNSASGSEGLHATRQGVKHQAGTISWADAQELYDALVKFQK